MPDTALYDRIIAMLPSRALKATLAQLGYICPEIDLIRIIRRYAPTFDDCLDTMSLLREQSADADIRALADACIAYDRAAKAEFEREDNHCVYEVTYQGYFDSPGAMEDVGFLCDSLQAVTEAEARFRRMFDTKYTGRNTCIVRKRPLCHPGETGALSTNSGKALYHPGMRLRRVSMPVMRRCTSPSHNCPECTLPCEGRAPFDLPHLCPDFPQFLKPGELVSYIDWKHNLRHAMCWCDYSGDYRMYNLIHLAQPKEFFSSRLCLQDHDHIPAAEVERITEEELSAYEQANVPLLRSYIQEYERSPI